MKAVIKRTYDKVYLYPVVMIICWTLNYWCDDIHSDEPGKLLPTLGMVFGVSNGIFSALIFMLKSEEARRRWQNFFNPPKQTNLDDFVEIPIQLDFEDDYESDFTNTNTTNTYTNTDRSNRTNRTSDTTNTTYDKEIDMSEMSSVTSPVH